LRHIYLKVSGINLITKCENDELLDILKPKEKVLWEKSVRIGTQIVKQSCTELAIPFVLYTPLLTQYMPDNVEAAVNTSSLSKDIFIKIHPDLLDTSFERIVVTIVHEYLGHILLSKNILLKSVNHIGQFSGLASYKLRTGKEAKIIGEPLNEAVVDYIAYVQCQKFFQKISLDYIGYRSKRAKLIHLIELFESKTYHSELYYILVDALQTNRLQLIIKFISNETGVKINPKKLLNMEIDEYIEQIREVFEQRKIET
jgi:hypothetical protein